MDLAPAATPHAMWSMYILLPIWPICHMCIDAFEDSNNMQENLLKQWKYFCAWGGILVQTFLCIVHFSFIKMVNASLHGGGDRRLINLWWIPANECVEGWTQTAVKLWKQKKIEWNLINLTPFMPLNLKYFSQRAASCNICYQSRIQSSFIL